MVDDSGNCSILHFGSNKCQRVTRIVIAAENFALIHGFDHAYSIGELVAEMTSRKMSLKENIDRFF